MQTHHSRDWVSRPQFAAGSRWRNLSRTHRSLEVEIVRITDHNVTIKPVPGRSHGRRWSRQQRNDRWTIPLASFLTGHRPI